MKRQLMVRAVALRRLSSPELSVEALEVASRRPLRVTVAAVAEEMAVKPLLEMISPRLLLRETLKTVHAPA